MRAAVVVCLALAAGLFAARGTLAVAIGRSLVCEQEPGAPAAAIVLDNVEHDYALFDRAAALQRRHAAPAFVLTPAPRDPTLARVDRGIVEVMARTAGLSQWRAVPFEPTEPISLHAAYEMRDRLRRERIPSVAIVSSGLRSRRSSLVYAKALGEADIRAACVPAFGEFTPDNWTRTWHGVQEVGLQVLKLQYYRFWVLGGG